MNMKKIKLMLLGIVFLLLGNYGIITCISTNGTGGFYVDLLACLGIFSPFIGLIIFFYGFFIKNKSDDEEK